MTDPLLLYDGTCGFCAASVQFVLRHESQQNLRFAPLEGRTAAELRGRHPQLAGVDSLVWVDGVGLAAERVLVRSDAVLAAARYLGRHWRLLGAGRLIPRRVRDSLYDLVARHRHRLMRPQTACYVPPPDARARFLG
jgi:predicted DCC family thiol-disulfide oxidoreductase YuxK